jgi:hypothetical protein
MASMGPKVGFKYTYISPMMYLYNVTIWNGLHVIDVHSPKDDNSRVCQRHHNLDIKS